MQWRSAFEAEKLRAHLIKWQNVKVYCEIIIFQADDDNNNVNNATNGKLLH